MSIRGSIRLVLASIPLLASGAFAQDEYFAAVTIRTTPVADGIYVLEGEGGNVGLCVGEDAAFLIDDQFAQLTEKIQAAVKAVTDQPIRFVVNTHYHGDHTGGNENFRNSGSIVISHEIARERMTQTIFNEVFERDVPPGPEGGLPDITFDRSMTFRMNGHTIDVVHVPAAHTDGDAFVYFREADVLHCGDLFFNRRFPFIDTGAGGSIDGSIAAIDSLLAHTTENTRVIPGHGPVGTRADLIAFQEMLKESRAIVQKGIDEGIDINTFVLSKPLAKFDSPWGQHNLPTDMFVRIVYASLRRQAEAQKKD